MNFSRVKNLLLGRNAGGAFFIVPEKPSNSFHYSSSEGTEALRSRTFSVQQRENQERRSLYSTSVTVDSSTLRIYAAPLFHDNNNISGGSSLKSKSSWLILPERIREMESIESASGGEQKSGWFNWIFNKGVGLLKGQWAKAESSAPGTIYNRVYQWFKVLLSNISFEEDLMKQFAIYRGQEKHLEPVWIFPNNQRGDYNLKQYVEGLLSYHQKWFTLSCCAVPFSALVSILPIPNVVMFWNLYRIYCHWQAVQGAKVLLQLLLVNPTTDKLDPHNAECQERWSNLSARIPIPVSELESDFEFRDTLVEKVLLGRPEVIPIIEKISSQLKKA